MRLRRATYVSSAMEIQQNFFFMEILVGNNPLSAEINTLQLFKANPARKQKTRPLRQAEEPSRSAHQSLIVAARPPFDHEPYKRE